MSNECFAIRVTTKHGERYFRAFGKNGRVKTAWTLAGATLFSEVSQTRGVMNSLKLKKKPCTLANIVDNTPEHMEEEAAQAERESELRRLLMDICGNAEADDFTKVKSLCKTYYSDEIPF